MGNYYSLYSKNLGLSGKMVWWSTEPNWSTKLGDLTGWLILTLCFCLQFVQVKKNSIYFVSKRHKFCKKMPQLRNL